MRDRRSTHMATLFLRDAYFSFVLTLSELTVLTETIVGGVSFRVHQLLHEIVFTLSKLWFRCTPVIKRT
jgi:hypothetical protein